MECLLVSWWPIHIRTAIEPDSRRVIPAVLSALSAVSAVPAVPVSNRPGQNCQMSIHQNLLDCHQAQAQVLVVVHQWSEQTSEQTRPDQQKETG